MTKRKQPPPCSSSTNSHCSFIIAGSRHLLRRKILQIMSKNGFKVSHHLLRNQRAWLRPRSPPKLAQSSRKVISLFPVQSCLCLLLKFSRNLPQNLRARLGAKSNVELKNPNPNPQVMMSTYHPLARCLKDWKRTRTTPRSRLLLC